MKLSLAILASAAGLASAAKKNAFAPKITKNTPKAAYGAKLMSSARAIRKLNQDEVDLTDYSIKFEKCQFVKQYPEEGANDEEGSFLQTSRFVIFRLCPDSSCGSCNYNYGEYIVSLEEYLEATLDYKQELQEQYCETCQECYENQNNGNNNGGRRLDQNENAWMCQNIDTSTCYAECQNIENMEENGYVDASEFVECQKLDYEGDYDQYGEVIEYYAGPMCTNSGTRITIGVFTDEECSTIDTSKEIEDYMKNDNGYTMKISYHLLKQTFAEGECVASCLQVDEDQNNNDNNNNNNQEKETAEVCQQLYEAAGKCEKTHGFEQGMVDYDNYYNQIRNEELVCDYISTLKAGHYDQTGEIVVSGGRTTLGGAANTSGGQKFALTFFILGSVGLAAYAAMLHSQLTKGAKADLSRQGGAMA